MDKERINEAIPHKEVRLVLDDGTQYGVCSIDEALKLADKAGLDLVEVAPTAKPPVCRVMDYGKFKFEKEKKDREARKKQRQNQVDTKEVKFRPKIEEHDYNVKLKAVRKFLEAGDKVKVVLRYRGREMMFQEAGLELLNKVKADVADVGVVDQKPEMMGKQQIMMISPIASQAGN
ncbi:translation initiation factor IF-3 [Seleniivibrio sp.]|uniref:translation initiation factor IF-3 n=1 Tax=Seleniivibrio sp. TaxID=2898801 RepID=UPI0025FB3E50|nr:translation initiation factor IF-3 [Seleniivibrio sp.]MCD8554726.1 translation initiation factor IF-3 [Seleniivibrio sp.]